jgi:hypothetical protein
MGVHSHTGVVPWNDAHALRYVDVKTMTVMLPLSERELPTLPAKIANSRSPPGKLPEQHGDSTTTVVPAMAASTNYCAAAAVAYLSTLDRHQQARCCAASHLCTDRQCHAATLLPQPPDIACTPTALTASWPVGAFSTHLLMHPLPPLLQLQLANSAAGHTIAGAAAPAASHSRCR